MANGTHKMVVLAEAAEGQVDELARWYDEQHLPDLVRVPGLVSAERFALQRLKAPDTAPSWDFLVLYEIDSDDPMAVVAEAGRRMGTAEMPASPALKSASTAAFVATRRATAKS